MDQGEPISPDTADLHRELSELYLEQGNLEAAAATLAEKQGTGEKADLPVWRYRWCIDQARLNETQGDLDGALALLDEAQRLYIRTPLPNLYPISAMKARIWVAQGRLTKPWSGCANRDCPLTMTLVFCTSSSTSPWPGYSSPNTRTIGRTPTIQAAMQLLERLLQAAEEGKRMGSVIEILVLQALAFQAQGNITTALVPLERALTLAEPEGFVRIFVDEGKPMAELLKRLDAKDGTLRDKAVYS